MIARRFQEAGCDAALHALDLQSGAELSLHPDQPVVLASVFKIFIALEFYAQVSAGLIDPAERLELDPQSLTAGPTGLSIFSDPVTLSWRDLCLQMMSVSDNAATDLLLARVGLDQVNARLRACGCSNSVIVHDLRTMFDEMALDIGFSDYAHLAAARSGHLGKAALAQSNDPGRVDAAAAFDPTRTNRSTPREMTDLLRAVWRDEATTPEACASVRAVMAQQVSSRLGRALPDGAVVAGKTGSLTGRVRNEA
ncbi:serine hydrolase, partial [Phenylobacterium sp.]|uniref:serine hydrolase n=1 Tax=Phenylobacterium sp. TaxID=1871053 RepID=UPI002730609C